MNAPLKKISRIGWIGTGVMGRWMCDHVMDLGVSVTVHNRSQNKTVPLLEKGAAWGSSLPDVATGAQVIFSIVGHPSDVREIYLGKKGLVAAAEPGTVFVDMTTSEPNLAAQIDTAARTKGCWAVDAPVSGGDVGARDGTLSIMVGGADEAVGRVRPLLEAMGRTIVHQGPAGAGQHTKMCNQIVIAGTMIGVCESLLYGYRAGLDLETMLSSIGGGAAACWTLDTLAPRVIQGDFAPGFYVAHFIKDMGIALKEAEAMGLVLPGLALVHQLYLAVAANGGSADGTQALMKALAQLSGETEGFQ